MEHPIHGQSNNQNSIVLRVRSTKKGRRYVTFYHETRSYHFYSDVRLGERSLTLDEDLVLQTILDTVVDSPARILGSLLTVPVAIDAVILFVFILWNAYIVQSNDSDNKIEYNIGILVILISEGILDAVLRLNNFVFLYRISFWVHLIFIGLYFGMFAYFDVLGLLSPAAWALLSVRVGLELFEFLSEVNIDYLVHNSLGETANLRPFFICSRYIYFGFGLWTFLFRTILGRYQYDGNERINLFYLCQGFRSCCDNLCSRPFCRDFDLEDQGACCFSCCCPPRGEDSYDPEREEERMRLLPNDADA